MGEIADSSSPTSYSSGNQVDGSPLVADRFYFLFILSILLLLLSLLLLLLLLLLGFSPLFLVLALRPALPAFQHAFADCFPALEELDK